MKFHSFAIILAVLVCSPLAFSDSGTGPSCLDDQGQPIPVNNAEVINWEKTTPNQYKERAHISGTLTEVYPDHSGHHHFAVQIGDQSSDLIEVIYNTQFGAMPALVPGMAVEACGDYITSTAQSGPYPPSPDGAILHWVHEATHGHHPSGFVILNGVTYGQSPGRLEEWSARIRTAPTGDQFYENSSGSPVLSLLAGATSSIDIETYTMNDPQFGQAIRDAVNRGVRVNVVEESSPVGATCHPFGGSSAASSQTPDCLRQQDLVNFVNSSGGQYVPFSKSLCGKPGSHCFEHGKMVIVDSSRALISTGNFDATSLCDISANPENCDRDYTIVTTDRKEITELQSIFDNDLSSTPSDLSSVDNSALTVSPDSMTPLVNFIGSAKHTLQIETQYLYDPTMNQAIVDAANRGVQVSVMVASACSFGKPKPSTVTKWQNIFSGFDSAGINTRVFDRGIKVGGRNGYLHAKAIIVDGTRAWVGSVNGSTTSLTNNREYGVFIDDPTNISKLDGFVSSDFQNRASESWQDSLACKSGLNP